ncbi:YheC/YheD family protein [Neobacillus drentensis]|uniref:YheC/YheD family protein n=1 Tax=Neobacillus drentensis TaxID=220684 RepID=UPI002FFF7FB9
MSQYIKRMSTINEKLMLLPEALLKIGEARHRRMIVNIGKWRQEVNVEFQKDLPDYVIGMASALILPFELPDQLQYEMKIQGRNIHLGPVIGFLAFREKQDMNIEALNQYLNYFTSYDHIKGLLFICAADSINYSNQTIEGFYYQGEGNGEEVVWKFGTFPFPDCLYLHIDVNKTDYDQMVSIFGDSIVSTKLCNKWELWEWLHDDKQLLEHLPFTVLLEDIQNLDELLAEFGSAYIKPVEAGKGQNFFKVVKTGERYRFIDYFTLENNFDSCDEAKEFLNAVLSNGGYLVQQAVPVKRYDQRWLDFIVMMQKNARMDWKCSYIAAQFSEIGSTPSFSSKTAFTLNARDAFRKLFQMDEREVFLKEQEIIELCIYICKNLEKSGGNYAEMGIHIILDETQKLWLITISPLKDHIALINSDKQLYLKVVTAPFDYAKAFSGFK